ncbi:MAG: hypothetical protein KDC80_25315 [Saprospiraceae bacterium]|nr:hypothetical protein [Saprospiraceae bacterium]
MKQNPWAGILLIIILMMLLMWPGFGDVFVHPNGFLFAKDGDGLKNYFNLGYYLKYDEGLRFTGVNYPYGENLLYTDTQPFYAFLLNLIDNHIWSIGQNSVAIINLSILLGMVLASVLLYLILIHFGLPARYSLIIAICITFLSPQWDRIHGHLSLSYAFVVPLVWYVMIRCQTSNTHRIPWCIALSCITLFVGGLHLYYTIMTAGFILAYLLVLGIRAKRWNVLYGNKSNWGLLCAAVIPFFALWLLSNFSSQVSDRPGSPYGFYVYHANIPSIFLPHYAASSNFINKLFHPTFNWEGRAFIGTASLIFVLGYAISLFHKVKSRIPVLNLNRDLSNYTYAALILLVFSMCIPFDWLRFIPEWFSPLKQFRALGRLSWVFFYVINVISAVYIYRIYQDLIQAKLNLAWSHTFLIFFLLIWVFDAGSFYVNHGPVSITQNDKLENVNDEYLSRFAKAGVEPHDFQAIFALPLVSNRTDKMTFEGDLTGHNEAMKCAFHSGLPIVQSTASRPSLSQALSSIQMISSPMIRKVRLRDMDDRPLLLLHALGSKLNQGEQKLLQEGRLLWEDTYIQLLELPVSAFNDSLDVVNSRIDSMVDHNGSREVENGIYCDSACAGVFFNSFENSNSANPAFWGDRSLTIKDAQWQLIDTTLQIDSSYQRTMSFWIYIDPVFSGMPSFEYFYGDPDSELQSEGKIETRTIPEVQNGWVCVHIMLKPFLRHRVVIYGRDTTIDNLMIRGTDQDVFVSDGKRRLFNNYPVY